MDRDAEGLGRSRAQSVAEGRELQLEFPVVPRHEDLGVPGDQLVVPEQGQRNPESAPQTLVDGNLQDSRVPAGLEHPPFDAAVLAVDLDDHDLTVKAGVHEEPGRRPDGDRRFLRCEDRGQRDADVVGVADEEILRRRVRCAEGVPRLVNQTVGAGLEGRDFQFCRAVLTVLQHAVGLHAAFVPRREDGLGVVRGIPAGPGPVAVDQIGILGIGRGRFLSRGQGPAGIGERDQFPRALTGARRTVEVRPGDRRLAGLAGCQEPGAEIDRRLDRRETQPEGPVGGSGLAAGVGGLDRQPEAVGDAALGLALVGLGCEGNLEGSVGVQLAVACRDHLRFDRRHRAPPVPPARVDRLPRHLPTEIPLADRKAEVVADRAAQRRRSIEPQRFRRVVDLDGESRTLVLLDPDLRRGAERGVQGPVPQHAPGGNLE